MCPGPASSVKLRPFGEVLLCPYFVAVLREFLWVPSPLCGENGVFILFGFWDPLGVHFKAFDVNWTHSSTSTCIFGYINKYNLQAHSHTYKATHMQDACTCTWMHAWHACMYACMHASMHAHIYTHTYIHPYIHTYIHIYIGCLLGAPGVAPTWRLQPQIGLDSGSGPPVIPPIVSER